MFYYYHIVYICGKLLQKEYIVVFFSSFYFHLSHAWVFVLSLKHSILIKKTLCKNSWTCLSFWMIVFKGPWTLKRGSALTLPIYVCCFSLMKISDDRVGKGNKNMTQGNEQATQIHTIYRFVLYLFRERNDGKDVKWWRNSAVMARPSERLLLCSRFGPVNHMRASVGARNHSGVVFFLLSCNLDPLWAC